MKIFIYSFVVAATLAYGGLAYAEHSKFCKNVHGKVTVVTEEGILVGAKMYKLGERTRLTNVDKSVRLSQIFSAGDQVCMELRRKDDSDGGEVAAVVVLSPSGSLAIREYVWEKETVREVTHDKNCDHLHGKVTRVQESTLFVDGKPFVCSETTRILSGDQTVTIETIKTGDFVCLDASDKDAEGKVTAVQVLDSYEAAVFGSRMVIREQEKGKIREGK